MAVKYAGSVESLARDLAYGEYPVQTVQRLPETYGKIVDLHLSNGATVRFDLECRRVWAEGPSELRRAIDAYLDWRYSESWLIRNSLLGWLATKKRSEQFYRRAKPVVIRAQQDVVRKLTPLALRGRAELVKLYHTTRRNAGPLAVRAQRELAQALVRGSSAAVTFYQQKRPLDVLRSRIGQAALRLKRAQTATAEKPVLLVEAAPPQKAVPAAR